MVALGIACFFTIMTIAEGGGRRAVTHKLRDMYLPTLKANFMVWPLVQIINFRLMPIQFQLVSSSCYLIREIPLIDSSHLYHQLVLLGRHTFPFPMLPKKTLPGQHLSRPIFDCFDWFDSGWDRNRGIVWDALEFGVQLHTHLACEGQAPYDLWKGIWFACNRAAAAGVLEQSVYVWSSFPTNGHYSEIRAKSFPCI